MIIDDLNEVKASLETTYKDFKKLKPYTLLKCVKKIIIDYKDDFSQREILTFINNVFKVEIDYANFNKFFISFCRDIKKGNKIKKKEIEKPKDEVKEEFEDIKKDTPKNEVPLKKTNNIVPENEKKVKGEVGKNNLLLELANNLKSEK